MTTRKLIIALFLITLLPITLFAQRTAGSFSIGGFGGIGDPMSPEFIKDFWKIGIGFGAEFKYNFTSTTSLGLSYIMQKINLDEGEIKNIFPKILEEEFTDELDLQDLQLLGYNSLDEFIDEIMQNFKINGGDLNLNIISANLCQYLTSPEASLGVYLTTGPAYYMIKSKDLEFEMTVLGESETEKAELDEKIEDSFGINGGLGLEFTSESISFFMEGKYHYLFKEVEIPLELEQAGLGYIRGNTAFFTVMGGIRISL